MTQGRTSTYTPTRGNDFCAELALGNSLRSVCSKKGQPTHQTVYNWLNKYPDFLEQYTRAKADSGDADADRIEEIAEKVLAGNLDPQAARVAIDAYKWTAGKKRPKKYGDRIHTEHSGHINDYTDLAGDELDRKLREMQQKLGDSERD